MISDTTTNIRYVVTDGVLSYGIPFRIYAPADVAVFWSVDARADTELTLGTHYTVTILTEGGMVNLLPGVVPVGAVLAVVSNIPATQEADFSSTSTVNTAALETQLDRQVQMIQQLEDSVARSVVLPATSSETPQDVVQDIYTARDDAEAAAAAAATSEAAAASSATSAAAHALLAEQSRGQACQCADRAEQARDVAMQQAETINVVMATEMGKINTAIAINKDDQAAAITASRAWSETDEDVPVDTDEQGNPEYSSKHWALKSAQLLAGNASKTRKGVMQVGSGLDVDEGVVSASVATTTSRGIARVAALADMEPDAVIENGPAFLAAGSEAVTTTPTPHAVVQADENGKVDLWVSPDANKANKNLDNVTNNAIGLYLYARDEKPSGTTGGSNTANAWMTRDVNTVVHNSIAGAYLSANGITLPAGRYYIEARMPIALIEKTRGALYNVTSSSYMIYSPSVWAQYDHYEQTPLTLNEEITLTEQSTLELRMWASRSYANGCGFPSGVSGVPEIYSEIRIWKM